jgi:hypothetical protein
MEHAKTETNVNDGLLTPQVAYTTITAKSYRTVPKVTAQVPWAAASRTAPFATHLARSFGFAVCSGVSL